MAQKVYWTASLSNGETLFENKGAYVEVAGELSPYQKLLQYCANNSLEITSVALYCGGKTFNLPSSGKKPRFTEFQNAEKPIKYICFRKAGFDLTPELKASRADLFTVVEAIYPTYNLQLWVDNEGKNCWVLKG